MRLTALRSLGAAKSAGYYAQFGKRDLAKDIVMRFAASMLLIMLTGCVSAPPALAAYPERPIRMIVPSAAGGQPDTNSRLVATELGKLLGRTQRADRAI